MKKHELKIIINRDFADVMHRCRIKREFKEGTWISNEMGKAYHRLYEAGYALSVEVMEDGELGGGLYSAFSCIWRAWAAGIFPGKNMITC